MSDVEYQYDDCILVRVTSAAKEAAIKDKEGSYLAT